MWKLFVLQALWCIITTHGFIRPTRVQLTEVAEVACELTGLIGDEVLGGDCCHFVKCDLNGIGWRFPCLGNTVWDSKLCACVKPKRDNTCRDTCAAIPTPGTVAPCPQDLGSEECCLPGSGQIFRADPFNITQYYFEDEEEPQACPPGQEFILESCCCEGPLEGAPKPCIQFDFTNNYIDSLQNVHGTPSGSLIVRPGFDGDGGAAKFGTASKVEVPYFSNAYYGLRFSASAFFKLEDPNIDEEYTMMLIHNGGEEAKGASIKMELVKCPNGDLVLVAGVKACDRVEDVVFPINEAQVDQWYEASMSYNDGAMTVSFKDASGNVITTESFTESDPMDNDDIIKIIGSSAEQSRRVGARASDAVQNIPQPQDQARAARLDEAKDCIDEVLTIVEGLGDFTQSPVDAIGLTALRNTRKALRPLIRRCKKGKTIDLTELQQLTDDFRTLLAEVNLIIADVQRALQKICTIKDDGELFRQILSRESRTEINTLKRKLIRVADAISEENPGSGGDEGGTFDQWLTDAEDCLAKQSGFRRRRRDADESVSIESTKNPLTIGFDFPGSLDQVQICFDDVSGQ